MLYYGRQYNDSGKLDLCSLILLIHVAGATVGASILEHFKYEANQQSTAPSTANTSKMASQIAVRAD